MWPPEPEQMQLFRFPEENSDGSTKSAEEQSETGAKRSGSSGTAMPDPATFTLELKYADFRTKRTFTLPLSWLGAPEALSICVAYVDSMMDDVRAGQ